MRRRIAFQTTSAAIILTFFAMLVLFVPLEGLTIVLNGMFMGAMLSIIIAFGKLIAGSMIGTEVRDRVTRMSVGFGYLWLTVICLIGASVYLRIFDYTTNATYLGAFGRYCAIVAATHMVTAPDYGLGFFEGRDRRLLWIALAAGSLFAIVTIYLQVEPWPPLSFFTIG